MCEIFRTFRFSRFLHVSFFKSSTFRFAGFTFRDMNKDDILKEFDTLAEAKRKGAVNLKLCLGFALLVVVLVLAWGAGSELFGTG